MFWPENRHMAMGCHLKDEDRWKETVTCCVRHSIEWSGRGRSDTWKSGKIFYRGFHLGIPQRIKSPSPVSKSPSCSRDSHVTF
jgi:hypothetical protein